MKSLIRLVSLSIWACTFAFSQNPPRAGLPKTDSSPQLQKVQPPEPLSTPAPVPRSAPAIPQDRYKAGFIKDLTVESFGYDLSPTGQGFEGSALSAGQFSAHGLECPYCVLRPLMNRSRFTLAPFGAWATLQPGERIQLFTGFGGVQAWVPDDAPIMGRRGTTYNDAWLAQSALGGSVALDPKHRLWLGGTGRYLSNFGEGQNIGIRLRAS